MWHPVFAAPAGTVGEAHSREDVILGIGVLLMPAFEEVCKRDRIVVRRISKQIGERPGSLSVLL
ncbi:hypothetical protein PoMZ_00773 [Pyricularia oryzae]|uniref:Uncharacterized protein n=1 Tax=Pyricularia oryzae TaxID=318829 RepID=A0A4P7N0M8_PYROR|nr:hypothetical protein PoMZ_00773 [Pyricularia oryzae]